MTDVPLLVDVAIESVGMLGPVSVDDTLPLAPVKLV